jgi:hypothetical protein
MTAPANEAPHEIEGTVEFSEVSFRLKDGKNKSFENMELDKRKSHLTAQKFSQG